MVDVLGVEGAGVTGVAGVVGVGAAALADVEAEVVNREDFGWLLVAASCPIACGLSDVNIDLEGEAMGRSWNPREAGEGRLIEGNRPGAPCRGVWCRRRTASIAACRRSNWSSFVTGVFSVGVVSAETSSSLDGDEPEEVDIELLRLLEASSAAFRRGVGGQTGCQESEVGVGGCVDCTVGVGGKLIFASVPLEGSGV